jgi:hypothetical protein
MATDGSRRIREEVERSARFFPAFCVFSRLIRICRAPSSKRWHDQALQPAHDRRELRTELARDLVRPRCRRRRSTRGAPPPMTAIFSNVRFDGRQFRGSIASRVSHRVPRVQTALAVPTGIGDQHQGSRPDARREPAAASGPDGLVARPACADSCGGGPGRVAGRRGHRTRAASTSSSSAVGVRAEAPIPRPVWPVRQSAVLVRQAPDAVDQSQPSDARRHHCAAVRSVTTRLTRDADRITLYTPLTVTRNDTASMGRPRPHSRSIHLILHHWRPLLLGHLRSPSWSTHGWFRASQQDRQTWKARGSGNALQEFSTSRPRQYFRLVQPGHAARRPGAVGSGTQQLAARVSPAITPSCHGLWTPGALRTPSRRESG